MCINDTCMENKQAENSSCLLAEDLVVGDQCDKEISFFFLYNLSYLFHVPFAHITYSRKINIKNENEYNK